MADKGAVRQKLYYLNRVKTWQLVIVLMLMLLVSATFLRLNNIGMVERRDAVIAADKSGDSYAIQNRVFDLQNYSSSRMNASSGPVYLTEQYNRDAQATIQQAQNNGSGGETIYAKADRICKQRLSGNSPAYVQCVASEIAAMPDATKANDTIKMPNPALYRYNFASPGWTPDFAGFSVLVTAIIALIIIIRLIIIGILRLLLKREYTSV